MFRNDGNSQAITTFSTIKTKTNQAQWYTKKIRQNTFVTHFTKTIIKGWKKKPEELTELTVFQYGCTIFHSYQQCMEVPVTPHVLHHLLLSVILMSVKLVGMYEYLNMVVIYISLITVMLNIFTCLLAICILSFVKYLFKSFFHLKNWIVFFFLSFKSSLDIQALCQKWSVKISFQPWHDFLFS